MVELAEDSAYLDLRRPKNPTQMTMWLAGGECYDNPPVMSCDGVELQTTASRVVGRVLRHTAKLPPVKDNALPYMRLGLAFKQRPQTPNRGHLVGVAIS